MPTASYRWYSLVAVLPTIEMIVVGESIKRFDNGNDKIITNFRLCSNVNYIGSPSVRSTCFSFLWTMGQASGELLTCALTVRRTWTKTGI